MKRWMKVERVVAKEHAEKQRKAIKGAFADLNNKTEKEGRGAGPGSGSPGSSSKKSKVLENSIRSRTKGRQRRDTQGDKSTKFSSVPDERRGSFGTMSSLLVATWRQEQLAKDAETRDIQLLKTLRDCNKLSKQLDYVKGSTTRGTKLSSRSLKKLSQHAGEKQRITPSRRKEALANLLIQKRRAWAHRPINHKLEEKYMALKAKIILSGDGDIKELDEKMENARPKETFILYTTITDADLNHLVRRAFAGQEQSNREAAANFWRTLEGGNGAKEK